MRKNSPLIPAVLLVAVSLAAACAPEAPSAPGPKGHLFIIGGGERDAPLMKRYIQLAEAHGTGQDRRLHHGQQRPRRGRAVAPRGVQGQRGEGRRLLQSEA